jgi:hypothetical protein
LTLHGSVSQLLAGLITPDMLSWIYNLQICENLQTLFPVQFSAQDQFYHLLWFQLLTSFGF